MAIALRDIPNDMFSDLLSGITFTDPLTNREINASRALLQGTHTIGQVFEDMSITAHSSVLYQMFNAQRIFGMLSQIPKEQFALLPGRQEVAYTACRKFQEWLPGFKKALEKGYGNTIANENERAIEINRIIANTVIAFLRKATGATALNGGDTANTEADITNEVRNRVIRYLQEKVSDESLAVPGELMEFIGRITSNEPTFLGITRQDVATNDKLRELLGFDSTREYIPAASRIITGRDEVSGRKRQDAIRKAL
jgi:hypothetical protein